MPLTKTSNRSAKILYRTSGTFSHLSIGIAPAILVFFSLVVLAGCALTANPGTLGDTGALKLTTPSLPAAHAGQAYFETLAIAGGTAPFSWSVSTGNLPAGVSLGTNNGALTGTPSKTGSFNFAIQVTDSSTTKQSASKTYSMAVMGAVTPVSISTSSIASGQAGVAYSATLAASGGTTPYSWSISSGALPGGLSLGPANGTISGAPTASGQFNFTVVVADSTTPTPQTAAQSFTLTIATANAQSPTVTTSSLPGGTVSSAYSAMLAASGGTIPYTWSITAGALPAGLGLTVATGVISGTPMAAGNFSFTVQAKDSKNNTGTRALSISIAAAARPLTITTASLPGGEENTGYLGPLAASGGITPYSWSITTGVLPTGVTLTGSSGLISGVPTESGTFPVTVQVKDSSSPSHTASQGFSISIAASSSGNCPTGQPCGATAPFCENYAPPSTNGATAISSLPFKITTPGNYFLKSDLSTAGNAVYITYTGGSPIDINLNGHTLTYGTTANGSGASQVAEYGILMCNVGGVGTFGMDASYSTNGQCASGGNSASNVTIENGTIIQSTNASSYYDPNNCPGSGVSSGCAHSHDSIASHPIMAVGASGLTVTHMNITAQQVDSDLLHGDYNGGTNVIECNTLTSKVYSINNRADSPNALIYFNHGTTATDTVQYNTLVGGPQNGIIFFGFSPGSTASFNDINLGFFQTAALNGGIGHGYTDDYAIGGCPPGGAIEYNYIHNTSGRGIGCVDIGTGNGLNVDHNYDVTTEDAVNGEYGAHGGIPGAAWLGACELEGGRGIETRSTNGVNIFNNTVIYEANQCDGAPMRPESAPCSPAGITCDGNSPINIHDNTLQALNSSGSSSGPSDGNPLACYLFGDVNGSIGYFTQPITNDSCLSDGEFAASDFDMASGILFANTSYTEGPHPISQGAGNPSGFYSLRWGGGAPPCGSPCPQDENGWVMTDMSYAGGYAENIRADNTSLAHSVRIQWTYNLTVLSSQGGPIEGAAVTVLDADNTTAGGTTDSNGNVALPLVDHEVKNSANSPLAKISHNPNSVTIVSAGCTTLTYSFSITATTTDSRTLTCP